MTTAQAISIYTQARFLSSTGLDFASALHEIENDDRLLLPPCDRETVEAIVFSAVD